VATDWMPVRGWRFLNIDGDLHAIKVGNLADARDGGSGNWASMSGPSVLFSPPHRRTWLVG